MRNRPLPSSAILLAIASRGSRPLVQSFGKDRTSTSASPSASTAATASRWRFSQTMIPSLIPMALYPVQGVASPPTDRRRHGQQDLVRHLPGDLAVVVRQDEAPTGARPGDGILHHRLCPFRGPPPHLHAIQVAQDGEPSPASGLDLTQVLQAAGSDDRGARLGYVIENGQATPRGQVRRRWPLDSGKSPPRHLEPGPQIGLPGRNGSGGYRVEIAN